MGWLEITWKISVDKHLIKEKIVQGIICIPYLPTVEQIVDVLTKGLPKWHFNNLIDKLTMDDISKPAWGGVLIIFFIVNIFIVFKIYLSIYFSLICIFLICIGYFFYLRKPCSF